MSSIPRIRFATDLCTFYDPRVWGREGGYADIGSLFPWGVRITHWKDAFGPAPADREIDDRIYRAQIQWFAQVSRGIVDWHRWARLLRDMNYRGWAMFELDGALDPPGDLAAIRSHVTASLGHLID